MLSLMDRIELEDLIVFRDDEIANKFYVLPDQPGVPIDEEGNAELLFIKYVKELSSVGEDEEIGGGYVQFRSTLTVDPERRQRVVSALHSRLEQEKAAGKKPLGLTIDVTEPLLAAPLWTDGTVTLLTFKVSDTGLVRHAPERRPVDLAGDLGASFALELDEDGAEIFWTAFEDPAQKIPIMVSYELTYKARVSAKMTIHAERRTIERTMWTVARPYYLLTTGLTRWVPMPFTGTFNSAALAQLRASSRHRVAAMVRRPLIRNAVQKSIQESEIEVRIVSEEGSTGEASEVHKMMFEVAADVLTERVVPAMFGERVEQPGSSSESDRNVTMDLIEVQSGLAGPGDASFDLTLDHQSVIERSVNPNGPLQLLIEDPDILASSFKELRLTDGFFSTMRVTAQTASVNFERDGIDLIKLQFRYSERDETARDQPLIEREPGNNDQTLIRSESDVAHWRFDTARTADGRHKREYEYRMEVFYREGPVRETEWRRSSQRQLVITPRAMGALRVELALTASSQVVQSARVALRHITAGGTAYQAERELVPGGDNPSWLQYTGEVGDADADLNQPGYSYQVTYRLDGGKLVMPWTDSNAELLEIPSPFAKTLNFNVRPQGSFDGVASIAGDIVYEDEAHEYRMQRSFLFTNPTDLFAFEVPILDDGPEAVRWTARRTMQDGSAKDLNPGEGGPGTIFIGGETSFLEVDITPELLDFETDVELAIVVLSYIDPEREGTETKSFTFSRTKPDTQVWRVGRSPGAPDEYDVDIRYVAYDRSKSSELRLAGVNDRILLLDRDQP